MNRLSSRGLLAALVAVLALAALLLLLLRSREQDSPVGDRAADQVSLQSANEAVGGAGESTVGAEVAVEKPAGEKLQEEDGPPPVPLLNGRIVGEGNGIPGAIVRLFPMSSIERAVERLQALVPDGNGIPDLESIFTAVLAEVDRVRGEHRSTRADAEGNFEFLPDRGSASLSGRASPGDHFVLALADGWLFRFGEVVSLVAGETRTTEISLDRGAAISGRVVDSEGKAVPGARIVGEYRPGGVQGMGLLVRRLLRYVDGEFLRGAFEAVSAVDGSFTLDSLPPGLYDLAAQAKSFPETRLRGVESGASDALIILGKGASLRGALIDGADAPVVGANLILEREEDRIAAPMLAMGMGDMPNRIGRWLGDGPLSRTTAENGAFRFERLAAGKYRLSLEGAGFLQFSQAVELEPGGDVDLGAMRVDRGAAIAGVVRLEDGSGVPGARVAALPAQRGIFGMGSSMDDLFSGRTTAMTDAGGSFRIAGLRSGKYRLTANKAGHAGAVQREVEVGAEDVEITMRAGARIAGRVVLRGGMQPIADAVVTGGSARAKSDADGRFVLEGVVREDPRANPVIDLAALPGGLPGGEESTEVDVKASKVGFLGGEAAVDLSSPAEDVEIALAPLDAIRGVVLDPEEKPVAGAFVRLVPLTPLDGLPPDVELFDRALLVVGATVSGPDGTFAIRSVRWPNARGEYQLLADHPLWARGASESLSLSADAEEREPIEIRVVASSLVKGVVTDGRNPVAGAVVRLRKAPTEGRKKDPAQEMFTSMFGLPKAGTVVHSASDGSFAYTRLEPGSYQISAEKTGFSESQALPVAVGAGATGHVTLVVDLGGEIAGDVVDAAGQALAGAKVRVLKSSSDDKDFAPAQRLFGASYRSSKVDDDGRFVLSGLPKGQYTLIAEHAGFIAAEIDGVSPGERKRLALAAVATIRGRVSDAANRAAIQSFHAKVEVAVEPEIENGSRRPMADLEFAAYTLGKGVEQHHPDGIFEISNLPAGSYSVSVVAAGYQRSVRQVVVAAGRAVEAEFALAHAGRIRGVVRDLLTSQPIAGARVSLFPTPESPRVVEPEKKKREKDKTPVATEPGAEEASQTPQAADDDALKDLFVGDWFAEESATTKDDGSYVLDSVGAGPQTVRVRHASYIVETKTGVEVASGQEFTLSFSLRRGLVVRGRVLGSDGKPLAGKIVVARGTSGDAEGKSSSAFSDAQGRFQLEGIEKGSYRIVLGQSVAVNTTGDVSANAGKSEALDLQVDRDVSGVELRAPAE